MAGNISEQLLQEDSFISLISLYVSAAKAGSIEQQRDHLKDLLLKYLLPSQPELVHQQLLGEYDREPIVAELIHEALCYSASKGLNEVDAKSLVVAVLRGLSLMSRKGIDSGLSAAAVKVLLSDLSSSFATQYGLQTAGQYLNETLIQHSHLYSYLMTEEQERQRGYETLNISAPPVPAELPCGLLKDEWFKREALSSIETSYEQYRSELREEKELAMKEERDRVELLYESLNNSFEENTTTGVDEEHLQSVIGPVIQGHLASAQTDLLHKLKQEETNFSYHIDRLKAIRHKGQNGQIDVVQ